MSSSEGERVRYHNLSAWYGHYEFKVMLFGVMNALLFLWTWLIDFAPNMDKFVMVLINDILLYSMTEDDDSRHLRIVLEMVTRRS